MGFTLTLQLLHWGDFEKKSFFLSLLTFFDQNLTFTFSSCFNPFQMGLLKQTLKVVNDGAQLDQEYTFSSCRCSILT